MMNQGHAGSDADNRIDSCRDGDETETEGRVLCDGGADSDYGSKARFELYRDEIDEWRWRLVHDNGNIIADSGEGYDRKGGAQKGLESVKRNAPGANVVVSEE